MSSFIQILKKKRKIKKDVVAEKKNVQERKDYTPEAIPKGKNLCMHSRIISKHGVNDCNIPISFVFGQ